MNYTQTPGLEEFPISDAKAEFYHQQSQRGNDIWKPTDRVFFLLLAKSQVLKPKGQDSKSVKSRKSNCRHSASRQVVGNKSTNFFGDLAWAVKSLEKNQCKWKYRYSAQNIAESVRLCRTNRESPIPSPLVEMHLTAVLFAQRMLLNVGNGKVLHRRTKLRFCLNLPGGIDRQRDR